MKVSKTFVKWFLVLFLIILVANISALAFGVWNQWFGWAFLALLALLFFLIFRKHKVGFVKFLAYFVPILLILAVLYVNILPFGYTDVQVINVGHARDTSGRFYLEQTESLGGRHILYDTYFRPVDGIVYAVYTPRVVLKNATITATLKGEDVYFITQPDLDFEWDYDWTAENVLDYFEVHSLDGEKTDIDIKDGCIYFDGRTRLVFPNSRDMFEVGPFAVYVEWVPENKARGIQLIGKFNWELLQDNGFTKFFVGRVYDRGPSFWMTEQNQEIDLNKKHSILGIYVPKSENNSESYMELYLNGDYSGRKYFGNYTVWPDYGRELTIGRTFHGFGSDNYFRGSICNIRFAYTELKKQKLNSIEFVSSDSEIRIPIFGEGGRLKEVELKVQK